jgi:hypothetical protein
MAFTRDTNTAMACDRQELRQIEWEARAAEVLSNLDLHETFTAEELATAATPTEFTRIGERLVGLFLADMEAANEI